MFRVKSNQKGLSIIELVVVIAVIFILASMLFPQFREMRNTSKKMQCLNNLKQLGLALELYRQDDKLERFPEFSGGFCWPTFCNVKDLPALIFTYLGQGNENALWSGELEVFRCPVASDLNMGTRIDPSGNQVDYNINDNLDGQSYHDKVGNASITYLLADYPPVPADASDHVHRNGSNVLFVDGHAEWLSRSRLNSPWPDEDTYPGSDYEDWGIK